MSIRIDFLSYEGERNNERHPHAQFVLPIAGELEISIGGAEGRLTPSCAAFVAPGVPHSQLATVSNAFLIVNCDLAECGVPAAEQLAEQIFLPVSEATRHLNRVRGAVQRPLFTAGHHAMLDAPAPQFLP